MFSVHRARLADLVVKHRLPTIYTNRPHVEAGGLMCYGPNFADVWRRATTYVDKILKGARPADLPVEQPIAAFRTSIYGASLRRSAAIPFHTGDAVSEILAGQGRRVDAIGRSSVYPRT